MKKQLIAFLAALVLLGVGAARAQYLTVGTGTQTALCPITANYKHNLSQSIYLASELGSEPVYIHAMAFHQHPGTGVDTAMRRQFKVYLSNTTMTGFSSNFDWETDVESSDLVYQGLFWFSNEDEWTTIEFSTPFYYDGSSNVVVTIIDDNANYQSNRWFYCSNSAVKRTHKVYNDNSAYSLSDLGNSPTGNHDLNQARANVRFFTTPTTVDTLSYIQVGADPTPTSSSQYNSPINAWYAYSASQQVFHSDDLGAQARTLYGVQFYHKETLAAHKWRRVRVAISVCGDVFNVSNSWATVWASDIVYKGGYEVSNGEGWHTVWFETPYEYNGDGGIVLCMTDTTGEEYVQYRFATENTGMAGASRTAADDGEPFDILDPGSGSPGADYFNRNVVRFITDPVSEIDLRLSAVDAAPLNQLVEFVAVVDDPENTTFTWEVDGEAVNATTPALGYIFGTTGTHTVSVSVSSEAGQASATHTVEINSCPAQELPFNYGFESDEDADCWSFYDDDADCYGWMTNAQLGDMGYGGPIAHGGNGYMCSFSYLGSSVDAENYMVLPRLSIPESGAELSWYVVGNPNYPDAYKVYVSTADLASSVLEWNLLLDTFTPGNWEHITLSLDDYAGQDVFIIFKHDDEDQDMICIDDISVVQSFHTSIKAVAEAPAGSTVSFYAGGPAGASYSWSFAGAANTSATGQSTSATWSAAGTYTVSLSATMDGVTSTATHSITINNCAAQELPFSCGFESDDALGCWAFIDADGDGYNSMYMSELESNYTTASWAVVPHTGADSYISPSYLDKGKEIAPLNTDHYIVLPKLHIPDNGATMKWYVCGPDSDYPDK